MVCDRAGSSGRNMEIDFYRVVMAAWIVLCHGGGVFLPPEAVAQPHPFNGGFLGVEFFFIVSGYFAAAKALKTAVGGCREAMRWTLEKVWAFLWYTIPISFVQVILYGVWCGYGAGEIVRRLLYSLYDVFLLRAAGFGNDPSELQLGILWYMSAFVLVLPLLYLCLLRGRKSFLYLGCTISAALTYGYFSVTAGCIAVCHGWLGFMKSEVPRAWAGLCMGCIAYFLSQKLKSMPPLTVAGQTVLAIVQAGCLGGSLVYMYKSGVCRLDFICIALMALLVAITLSERSPLHWLFRGDGRRLARLSMAVYVCQWTVCSVFIPALVPNAPWAWKEILFVVISFLYAALWIFFIERAKRLHPWEKLKKLLFVEEPA